MTYKELYEKAAAMLDRGEITLGDFNKMVKPLDVEIQPEPHWIPVTERPPETTGEYLVTKREMYTHRLIIDIAMYFVNDGWHKADPVIAWMPKPEPYKGVTE